MRGGGDQRHWLAVLGDDHDGEAGNVRAALAWFLAHGRLDDLADMAWALWVPAWINGRIDEGRRLAQAALDADGELSDRSRARLARGRSASFQMWSGDHDAAIGALRRGRRAGASPRRRRGGRGGDARREHDRRPRRGRGARRATGRRCAGDATSGSATRGARRRRSTCWVGCYVSQERFDGDADVFERTLAASLAAGDEQFTAMAEVNLAEYAPPRRRRRARRRAVARRAPIAIDPLRLLYSVAYLLDAARSAGRGDAATRPERPG